MQSCGASLVPIGVVSVDQAAVVHDFIKERFLSGDPDVTPKATGSKYKVFDISTPPFFENTAVISDILDDESIEENIDRLFASLKDVTAQVDVHYVSDGHASRRRRQ